MILVKDFKIFVYVILQIFVALAVEGIHIVYSIFSKYPRAYLAIIYLFITMAFCYYPIFDHWITGFIMMSLPVAIIGGLIASCYLLYKKQKMLAATGFIWVLMTFPILKRMVGNDNGEPMLSSNPALKVLSFNSESFGDNPKGVKNWSSLQADIACFQEYSFNRNIEAQYSNKIVKLTPFDHNRAIGLALFSQYPIIKEYSRIWDRKGQPNINGYVCADIAYKKDTVRVVNVHLWSMGVRVNQATDALKKGDIKQFAFEIFDSFRRLKEGFEKRDEQIKEIESYVSGSKYPVIICGDFNETPFGYTYGKLRLSFKNAFEEAGKGLGFSLNRHPYWVRIDQQFFSADWQVQSCQTMSAITFSDHFPVVAQYVLKKTINNPTNLVANR